jgi:hypothetical protein
MKTKPISIACVALITLCGCASQSLSQYSTFATAGTVYVSNFHQVTTQAGSAMIAVDSVVLITARRNVGDDVQKNPAHYAQAVTHEDDLLEQHLAALQLIDRHATLLGSYFEALAKLSDNKSASTTTSAADDLFKSIETLNPTLGKATLGGKSIESYVTTGTPFVVAQFQVKALDEQLARSAPAIDTALSLQEAAVGVIATEMRASLTDALKSREQTDVVAPYLKTGDLPASWPTNREAYLRASVTLNDVDSAQSAIKQLHIAFKQLVENKSAPVDLQSLISSITQMSTYASSAQSAQKAAAPK